MKPLILFSLLSFSIYCAAQPSQEFPATAKMITVYLSGAEIHASNNVSLKKGVNRITFTQLPPSLIENSFQVSVAAGVEILSISRGTYKLSDDELTGDRRSQRDSIALLEDLKMQIESQLDAFESEKKMLQQNMELKHLQTASAIAELSKAADFFRTRILAINKEVNQLHKKLQNIEDELSRITGSFRKLFESSNRTRYRVELTVNSSTDQNVAFDVRFLVRDASWEPLYDIIAEDVNKPIAFRYKAHIYNDTEVAWNNVALTHSTSDISMDATRPYLTAWNLNYKSTAKEGYLNNYGKNFNNVDSTQFETNEVGISDLNAVFNVVGKHSIGYTGTPYTIALREHELQATFEYLIIPKIEASAFLLAKVTGWERLSLVDGTANVYFGNTYVGESKINTRLMGDTLELSFGRDKQIMVSRSKIEDKGSTQSVGGKRTESFTYELQVKNNRNQKVSIRMQDQVPISQEKDITVEIKDISGAELDIPSGRLQWRVDYNPGEAKKYNVVFDVRYPKNSFINIRENRVVRTPRYRY